MYRHQNRWWKTFSQSEQAEDLHSGILLPWWSEHQFQRICIWEEVPHSFSITLPKPHLKLKRHDSGANCTLSLWRTAKHLTNNDWCVKYHCYQYLPDWAALVINISVITTCIGAYQCVTHARLENVCPFLITHFIFSPHSGFLSSVSCSKMILFFYYVHVYREI